MPSPAAPAPAPAPVPGGASVLLVDDRPENLLALEAVLAPLARERGARVLRAAGAEDALRHVLAEGDALAAVLLDVQMPGVDGLETARLIRRRARSGHVPILLVTAHDADPEAVAAGYAAGAVDYLFKPLAPDVVRAKVRTFLELQAHQTRAVAAAAALAAAEAGRAAAEVARAEEAGLVATVQRIGAALASELDLARIVQLVTDEATALTGAQFGAFFYTGRDPHGGGELQLYTLSGVPHAHFGHFPHPRATPVFGPTFRGEGVVRSADITAEPHYGRMAPHHGMPAGHLPVKSYLAVPVRSRTGAVLGGLFFGHERAGVFGEREERLVVGVAGWAAVAMDNARLYADAQRARLAAEAAGARLADQALELELTNQQLQDQAAELEMQADTLRATADALAERTREAEAAAQRVAFLAEASARLAGSLDVEATLRTVAELAVPALADWSFVEVLEGTRVRPAAVAHTDPAMVRLAHEILARYPIDLAAPFGTGKVFRTGEAELAPEIPDAVLEAVAQDAVHLDALRRVGFRSSLSVPLTDAGARPVAVLSLVAAESGRRYGDADLVMAEEVARRASAALASARLYEAGQAALRRATALQRVAAALGGVLTAAEVAAVVVHHGRAAVGASAGSFAAVSADGRTFEMLATEGYDGASVRAFARFPVTPGRPLSDAVRTETPTYIESLEESAARFPEMTPILRATGFEAYVALPVRAGADAAEAAPRGRGAAAGLSFSFAGRRTFDAEERTFLATLAAQAGQALERARLVEAERAARAESEAANRAKSEFLTTMSHELRTPLNAVAGYAELLELGVRGPVTEAQRTDLQRLRRANQHLTGLVADILNFARLEAGRVAFDVGDVPLAAVVADVEALVAPQLAAKGLTYDDAGCGSVGGGPPVVRGDAEKVRLVLLNLVTNAVKFTDAGGRVVLTCERVGGHPAPSGVVHVRVTDTGRGIPADQLPRVFEPFVQLERHRTPESQQGVGLGLAISRDLARAMGGDLTVESTPGVGSTFTLTLPAG